jgi:hypothetical protein
MMCKPLYLKCILVISTLCIIIGIIVGSIGAAELPRHIYYDSNNPMPADPNIIRKQFNDLQIQSPAYKLVVIGWSLFGGGVVCFLLSVFPLLWCVSAS